MRRSHIAQCASAMLNNGLHTEVSHQTNIRYTAGIFNALYHCNIDICFFFTVGQYKTDNFNYVLIPKNQQSIITDCILSLCWLADDIKEALFC